MNNVIIKKPWGYEYLAYHTPEVGVWILHINPYQSTSMHCHTEKTTGLIVLDGKISLSFLGDEIELNKLDKRMIRRGLFHSSKSISSNQTILLEIETPNNKEDLVRLKDEYGRKLQPYETESSEPEEKTIIKFDEPENDSTVNSYSFANCVISIEKITNINSIFTKNDNRIARHE
jgi:mannose-6-phosphate isomerase-like protein (cupin superfamily)